nr:unnamed protein product [Callosobruchus chinensis]
MQSREGQFDSSVTRPQLATPAAFSPGRAVGDLSLFYRHNVRYTDQIEMGNYQLPFVKEIRYLGVELDRKLTWKPFVSKIQSRCQKGLNFLRTIAKVRWGANQNTCLLFYRAYILSILDYGSILYGAASKNLLKQLDTIQNKALRICLGTMLSTPIVPLHVEAGIPPLQFRRQLAARKFILKSQVKKSTLLNKISALATLDLVNSYWTLKTSPPLCEAFRETPSLRAKLSRLYDDDPTHSFFDFIAQATVIIPTYTDNTIANRCILQNLLNNYTEYIQVYTDGSKNESATYRLPDVSSIFSAEAYAILRALDVASEENSKIIILSDSMSVIKLLQQSFPPSVILNPYLARIKSKVYDLRRCHKEVVIIWTKAHTGIQYNEAVDALAKSAVLNQNVETDAVVLGDCISFTKKLLQTSWSEYYQDYCRNRPTQYTAVQDHIPVYPWYSTVKMPRKLISMYSRLRFGLVCYPSLLARFGIVNDPLCDECQIESNLNHIFFECHKYRVQKKPNAKETNPEQLFSSLQYGPPSFTELY